MIQQITISIEPPAGYEATGEYREPGIGEWFQTVANTACCRVNHSQLLGRKRIILRKVWSFPGWFAAGWEIRKGFVSPDTWTVHKDHFGRFMFCDALWAFHGETFTPPTVDKLQCVR